MKKEGITIHRIIWYTLLFSVLGLIIETIYCFATTGILESRKGLILGPFCPIYGVGASVLIILLNNYSNSKVRLFCLGAIYGTIFEYVCSYVMQVMYGSRFWDYSYTNFQINGRISLTYTVFWGILSVILIGYLKGFLDKWIEKIPGKMVDKVIVLFVGIDVFVTILGISVYMDRAKSIYEGREYENTFLDYVLNDSVMSFTFPNLRYMDSEGREIFVKDIIGIEK